MTQAETLQPAASESKPRLHIGKWQLRWSDLLIGISVVAILVIFGAWTRPIWLDEMLHFSMGHMSLLEALQTIDYTTIELNHGQTGVYMLADWALLQTFGASAIALRLPSLIASLVLMWAAVLFLRNRGMSWFWQWFVLVALAGSAMWVYFIAEARPYMPLAASAVALVAFYCATSSQRRSWPVRIVGVVGLIGGALFHPYWIYYLGMAGVFGLLVAWSDRSWSVSLKSAWRFAGGWFLVVALVVFAAVGQLTWMRRVREFNYDPFEWLGSPGSTFELMLRDHLVGDFRTQWLFLGTAVLIVVISTRPWRRAARLLLPIVLLILGLASSLLISYLSFIRDYWIFERQWIGGVALCLLAMVWLFGELWNAGSGSRLRWRRIPSAIFVVLIAIGAVTSVRAAVEARSTWAEANAKFAAEARSPEEILADLGDENVVYAANVNIVRGGPVWPGFSDYYWKQAGMRPEFRADNPGWTRFLGATQTPTG